MDNRTYKTKKYKKHIETHWNLTEDDEFSLSREHSSSIQQYVCGVYDALRNPDKAMKFIKEMESK